MNFLYFKSQAEIYVENFNFLYTCMVWQKLKIEAQLENPVSPKKYYVFVHNYNSSYGVLQCLYCWRNGKCEFWLVFVLLLISPLYSGLIGFWHHCFHMLFWNLWIFQSLNFSRIWSTYLKVWSNHQIFSNIKKSDNFMKFANLRKFDSIGPYIFINANPRNFIFPWNFQKPLNFRGKKRNASRNFWGKTNFRGKIKFRGFAHMQIIAQFICFLRFRQNLNFPPIFHFLV